VDVDPVKQRPRNPRPVAVDLLKAAAALVLGIGQVAAWTSM